jgi:glutamate N-acetyltransferase / amino-acid N-acetyltransferase
MTTPSTTNADRLTLPAGFRAAGIHAGIKKNGAKDLALLITDAPAAVAGVFTTNKVNAAPVKLCRERMTHRTARAVLINSGNANACTGPGGRKDADRMAEQTAACLQVDPQHVWICSTGSIGFRLPMDIIEHGIRTLAPLPTPEGGNDAADAIKTTDLDRKHWTVTLPIEGRTVTVCGIAKGAGMIEPNMATMLAFLMTDAHVEPDALQRALTAAVNQSFNRITVDGDQSTNDTVLLLANGLAGPDSPMNEQHPDWPALVDALNEVALQLALKIVDDGEGSNKRITVEIEGAASDEDADKAARAIANSFLVKTSWAGAFPIWGRLMDCLGYSGAEVDENNVDIWYNDQHAVHQGLATGVDLAVLQKVIAQPRFTIRVDMRLGEGRAVIYTCEITEEYVRINVT